LNHDLFVLLLNVENASIAGIFIKVFYSTPPPSTHAKKPVFQGFTQSEACVFGARGKGAQKACF
jgi:hypothetical protein